MSFITKFEMEWIEMDGGKNHWSITLEKGDNVVLKEYLDKARELTDALNSFKRGQKTSPLDTNCEVVSDEQVNETRDFFQPTTDDINVENIPF